MRTKTLLLTAAVCAAGVATSMAQVYSANVVGYVNKQLQGAGGFTLVANPLDTTNNTFGSLFSSLPVGSQVLKWTGTTYSTATRVAFGSGWTPAGAENTTANPGEGLFIKTPDASANITNTFVGEVMQGNLTNSYAIGFTLSGNQVPDAGTVTAVGLTAAVPTGGQLLKWNPTTQSYETFTKVAFGTGWTPTLPSLDVGDGFFINANASFDWVRNFTVN
jgi:hypothetical protein